VIQVEHIGGTKVRFTWSCGHYRTEDLALRPLAKRIPTEAGVRFLVGWWSRNDGVHDSNDPCPTCKNRRPTLPDKTFVS
jgi:hypothetical protein